MILYARVCTSSVLIPQASGFERTNKKGLGPLFLDLKFILQIHYLK